MPVNVLLKHSDAHLFIVYDCFYTTKADLNEAYVTLPYCPILLLSVPQITVTVIPDATQITVACYFIYYQCILMSK